MYTELGLAQMKNCGKIERKTKWKSPVQSFACALGYHSYCHDGACLSLRMSVCHETKFLNQLFVHNRRYAVRSKDCFVLGRSRNLVPSLRLKQAPSGCGSKNTATSCMCASRHVMFVHRRYCRCCRARLSTATATPAVATH